MARLVKLEATKPVVIEIGGEKKGICACGLTTTPPFCNGNHKRTHDEQPGKVYQYDGTNRTEVQS